MVAEPPLSRVVVHASSVADDLGFVALTDLARIVGPGGTMRHRVIGGHMVTALVARWSLGDDLRRETNDVDLGVPPIVVRDAGLIDGLLAIGYRPIAGNRFARTMTDVPVAMVAGPETQRRAIIDILVPSYTSRIRQDRRISDNLVTTEVPGLATALRRPPLVISLELHRLNGEVTEADLTFPDEPAALVLKAFASQVRAKPTDVVDIWRCLEIAYAAGVDASVFAAGEEAEGAAIVRRLFATRSGPGMTAMTDQQRLSGPGADRRFTRIRALIERLLPG